MRLSKLVPLGAVILCCGLVSAEQIDNPPFQHWHKFAEGSSSTCVMTTDAAGMKANTQMTAKLVSKSDDAVTVEIKVTVEVAGQKHEAPTQTQKIPAKVDKEKQDMRVSDGTEKVEAAGKTFDCKIVEVTRQLPSGKTMTAKYWFSDEVPGGMVKMETKSEHGNVTSLLQSYEAK